jgi:hypothetical protein
MSLPCDAQSCPTPAHMQSQKSDSQMQKHRGGVSSRSAKVSSLMQCLYRLLPLAQTGERARRNASDAVRVLDVEDPASRHIAASIERWTSIERRRTPHRCTQRCYRGTVSSVSLTLRDKGYAKTERRSRAK